MTHAMERNGSSITQKGCQRLLSAEVAAARESLSGIVRNDVHLLSTWQLLIHLVTVVRLCSGRMKRFAVAAQPFGPAGSSKVWPILHPYREGRPMSVSRRGFVAGVAALGLV